MGDRLFTDVVNAEGQTHVQENERVDGTIGEPKVCRDPSAGVGRYGVLEGRGEKGEHAFIDRDFPRMLVHRARDEVVVVSAVSDRVEHAVGRCGKRAYAGGEHGTTGAGLVDVRR